MSKQTIVIRVSSLGCAKNLVDTEVMCGCAVTDGMYLTCEEDQANVWLINTCSFIRDAREEAYEEIATALAWKNEDKRKKRLVVVAGCLPQRYASDIAAQYPDVDLFLGLDDVPKAADLIRGAFEKQTGNEVAGGLATYLYDEHAPRMLLTPETYGYIKIAEGCDHRCAFCAIPLFRGRQRSRSIESILAECRQLLAQGVNEINLIAQDTSRYGLDRKDGANLTELLKACDGLPGEFWLRVLYTHPSHVTKELLDVMTQSRHVVPYLDMPIQHIADSVLKNMGRGMSGADLRAKLAMIRRDYPELTFRTTVLVGFPGETEEDFQELLSFVKEFKFDRLGAFAYSAEQGTPAEKLTGLEAVPGDVAEARRDALLEAQQEVSRVHNEALVGKTMTVLLEEPQERGFWLGRTAGDAADVDQTVVVKARKRRQAAGFAKVCVTGASEYDVTAEEVVK